MLNPLKKLVSIPFNVLALTSHKLKKYKYESKAKYNWGKVEIPKELLEHLNLKLQQLPTQKVTHVPHANNLFIVNEIKNRTSELNKNNITRTKAYLEFFKKHPEVHWALLAHLVSRNGGWNMTDLKGSLLRNFLSQKQQKDFFMFLERANSLIFHDAYPQLLLYEKGKQLNKNFFHLLPHFNVSLFMQPVWELFISEENSQFLTISLIINEQQYIEKRVIQNTFFQENVLNTLLFQAQEFLQFTQVLFPFHYQNDNIRLAGFSVHHFSDISERIEIGKRLYSILFGIDNLSKDITFFANSIKHTGSRSDFWPHVFSKEDIIGRSLSNVICTTKEAGIYSPPLLTAWNNVEHSFLDDSDWYKYNPKILKYFAAITTPTHFDITHEYCLKLQKMQVASTVLKE
ncbi:DUF2515 domain-containing protein [Alkalihalobacterium elongatum]|uniref:DUF2515 domain-containing protein n=1 Tax=Alkalihalobacterium elongatum TaxID=2675466 RepID=UPI001C1FC76A|nr:DUF2515 domain-containing protein [Alkalihalobacterium elongatum]